MLFVLERVLTIAVLRLLVVFERLETEPVTIGSILLAIVII